MITKRKLTVTIDSELYDKVYDYAAMCDKTLSKTVNELLKQYLDFIESMKNDSVFGTLKDIRFPVVIDTNKIRMIRKDKTE